MRFIHTADWHLGRSLNSVRLLADQRHVLNQIIILAQREQPDALIIAGDLFDRATPSGDAIDLLDDTLCAILEMGIRVIVIAGNHDGPHLINFGSRLFKASGLYTFGKVSATNNCITLQDQWGPVVISSLPYAEPLKVGEELSDPTIDTHEAAVRTWASRVHACRPAGARMIAVAHAFVAGGNTCDSERPMVVGGAASVHPSNFDNFDYVALGHLHQQQTLTDGRIHYAGSILKYSFSEHRHIKSVNLVEMDERGICQVDQVPLTPCRDLRCIEGYFQNILRDAPNDSRREDYMSIRLLDEGPLLDPMNRLRQYYPYVMETPRSILVFNRIQHGAKGDYRGMSIEDLFTTFFEQVTGAPLGMEESEVFAEVMAEMQHSEREVLV